MTLIEIKNQYAKKYGYDKSDHLTHRRLTMDDVDEIARLYAEAKCKEQREMCVNNCGLDYDYEDGAYDLVRKAILNAPAPKMD